MNGEPDGAPAGVVGGAGRFVVDLEQPVLLFLSSIPWEGPPPKDPDRDVAADFLASL